MLREGLEGAHRARRQHHPAQAPAGHAEVLREAVDQHHLAGKIERRPRLGAVHQPLVDLVDKKDATPRRDEVGDQLQFFAGYQCPRGVGRRAEQQSLGARAPGGAHHLEGRLETVRRVHRQRARHALEGAHEMAVPRVARIGHEHLVARVDVERCGGEERA
jgi:hypothetical protein